jgi:hypothetical protein
MDTHKIFIERSKEVKQFVNTKSDAKQHQGTHVVGRQNIVDENLIGKHRNLSGYSRKQRSKNIDVPQFFVAA